MSGFPLQNWIPYKLETNGTGKICHWLDAANEPFIEPFFDETIAKLTYKRRAYSSTNSLSNLELMHNWAAGFDEVKPCVIVFHISRCGSTLVSQLLGLSLQHTVLAEVPFLDDILRLPFKFPELDGPAINKLFKSALRFYAQKREISGRDPNMESRLIIKADSWHLFFYHQLRTLYPDVPFVMIYRKPNEVFRSHRKQPGLHSVPGLIEPQLFGIEAGDKLLSNFDAYLARVLERYFERCLDIIQTDNNFLLLNYNEGPMPMITKIADFAGIRLNNTDLTQMEERSGYHSKRPAEKFGEEAVAAIPICLEKAMQLYHELEEKRTALYEKIS